MKKKQMWHLDLYEADKFAEAVSFAAMEIASAPPYNVEGGMSLLGVHDFYHAIYHAVMDEWRHTRKLHKEPKVPK